MNDTWQVFAENLFRTEDADPVYYAMARSGLDKDTLARFFVGWCTYYHPGVAADAAQHSGTRFWDTLQGWYETAPRATERRHFRGQAGLKALAAWQQKFPNPEDMVYAHFAPTYFECRRKLETLEQFGDYFYWKFADVQERVFQVPCSFQGAASYSPKVPREGARLIHATAPIEAIYEKIVEQLRPRLAPPWYDRPIGIQEAETVCCVYHQMVGGGYEYYGHRTDKAFKRLTAALNPQRSPVAAALLDGLTLSLPHTPRSTE